MDRGQTDEEADSLEPRKEHKFLLSEVLPNIKKLENNGMEVENAATTRKVSKADREKLRRDKLNEQFLELGNLLDPDRPKNDKGTIITETIQALKDLNSEVQKLKADHAVLREESQELTQEKNEIREEKASLKSSIHDLKASIHLQQPQGFMVPWPHVDSQVMMAPSYPFPVAVPIHQTQPLPLFANHIPYLAPVVPRIDQPATSNASNSYISRPRASSSRPSYDVATDLELKVPGSAAPMEFSAREKSKHSETHEEKPSRK